MAGERLAVTVAIVAYNEAADIGACLQSLCALDYPRELYDILVVDNGSTDATRDITHGFAQRLPGLRVVVNPQRGVGAQRNTALRQAARDFLAFTDADCTVPPDWLSQLERAMREARAADPRVAAVGGPNREPEVCSRFRRAVAIGVKSYWGNQGSVQGALLERPASVAHLPTLNVLYDRKLVLAEGGFDEQMGNISEDVELSYRLRWRGYTLMFTPAAVVRHKWRGDISSWARNIVVYGKGRIWLMKKDRRFFHPLRIAPLGLLAATLLFPLTRLPLYLLPALYLVLTAIASVQACLKERRPGFIIDVFVFFIVTHYAYGIGEVVGLLQPRGCDVANLPPAKIPGTDVPPAPR